LIFEQFALDKSITVYMIQYQRLLAVLALSAICLYPCYINAYPHKFFETPIVADRPVTGKVTSDDGSPLADVSIVLKGTSTGTVSDANGNFTINIPDKGGTLLFTFVGYVQKEVAIKNQKVISVSLSSSQSTGLNEVVVIGYGTTKKSDLTGSVASIKSEDLKRTQVTSFDQALQGRAAGVQVTQLSGKPGAET
jgi:hypothetical protein